MVWTEDRLYYLVEITDNYISTTRQDDPLDSYSDDDCLELFINEDNTGGIYYENGWPAPRTWKAFAYHLSFGGVNVAEMDSNYVPILLNDHVNFAIGHKNGTDLYTWEVEMKIYPNTFTPDNPGTPVKLSEGKVMGFAVAYCDADAKNERERFIGSVYIPGEDKNIAWMDASVFAKLYLVK